MAGRELTNMCVLEVRYRSDYLGNKLEEWYPGIYRRDKKSAEIVSAMSLAYRRNKMCEFKIRVIINYVVSSRTENVPDSFCLGHKNINMY